jgi:hypothetical protein
LLSGRGAIALDRHPANLIGIPLDRLAVRIALTPWLSAHHRTSCAAPFVASALMTVQQQQQQQQPSLLL